jgi:hypothetical protein
MAAYAVIDSNTNIVVNTVEWDGVTEWSPPEGTFIEPLTDGVGIGWTWDGTSFHTPPAPAVAPTPTISDLQAQLAALTAQINSLATPS